MRMSLDQRSIYIYIFVALYRPAPFCSLEDENVLGPTKYLYIYIQIHFCSNLQTCPPPSPPLGLESMVFWRNRVVLWRKLEQYITPPRVNKVRAGFRSTPSQVYNIYIHTLYIYKKIYIHIYIYLHHIFIYIHYLSIHYIYTYIHYISIH